VRKNKLAKPMVDIFSAGVVEAHVEFDEEAHEKVEVEVGHESVRVDVANATCVVGNVENKLWELCRSVHGAAMGERGGCLLEGILGGRGVFTHIRFNANEHLLGSGTPSSAIMAMIS